MNTSEKDIFSGKNISQPISKLEEKMDKVYEQLSKAVYTLEKYNTQIRKVLFTIEEGKLFILKRDYCAYNMNAELRIVMDMVKEGLLTEQSAICNIDPEKFREISSPAFVEKALEKAERLCKGFSIPPSCVASGRICLTVEDAKHRAQNGDRVIMIFSENQLYEIYELEFLQGFIMIQDGSGECLLSFRHTKNNCFIFIGHNTKIDKKNKTILFGNTIIRDGDYIAMNGCNGNIYKGDIPIVIPESNSNFWEFIRLVNKYCTLNVNKDVGHDEAYDIYSEDFCNELDKTDVDVLIKRTIEKIKFVRERL